MNKISVEIEFVINWFEKIPVDPFRCFRETYFCSKPPNLTFFGSFFVHFVNYLLQQYDILV